MTATVPSPALLWLVEDDVRRLVSLNDTIDALDDGLRREARGEAANIDKALGQWDGGTVHALGSMMPSHGYTGIKTWANTPNGAAAIFSLFSTRDGRLLAIMEAGALGSMPVSLRSPASTDSRSSERDTRHRCKSRRSAPSCL